MHDRRVNDPHHLQRFLDAQIEDFEVALEELRSGAKRSHWMWYIFPQLKGLGRSPTARFYGIQSIDEARAYLNHPVLGRRLRECLGALMPWAGQKTAEQIFGPIDSLKLRSCLTLFETASGERPFSRGLDAFFEGRRDDATLDLLTGI
jgi:uncharacterized protein (DUF1810 family)